LIESSNFGGGKVRRKRTNGTGSYGKSGKPLRPGDVAKSVGLPEDEVSKIIRSLKKKGKITSPKRCFYAPAE